jgi:uncharacterized membrane protein YoaK (UPF0700 family)
MSDKVLFVLPFIFLVICLGVLIFEIYYRKKTKETQIVILYCVFIVSKSKNDSSVS